MEKRIKELEDRVDYLERLAEYHYKLIMMCCANFNFKEGFYEQVKKVNAEFDKQEKAHDRDDKIDDILS